MNQELSTEYWRKCSSCKNAIGYVKTHYVCSVSTCTRKRTGYVFCSVHCWERHLPGARHRDAAAIEAKSPTYEQWKAELESETSDTSASGSSSPTQAASLDRSPQRVIVRPTSGSPTSSAAARPNPKDPLEQEILVVASKLKAYIRARSEMNTSDAVMDALSAKLRRMCDRAIETARADGRKTVMDRDFEK